MLIFLSFNAFAAIIHVPEDHQTIQEAILAATSGDTILVADGTHRGFVADGQKAITIESENGPQHCNISYRLHAPLTVIEFGPTPGGANSTLSGFTFENIKIVGGEVINILGSSPIIEKCIFNDNISPIYCRYGDPQIQDCTFNYNEATFGGAICAIDSAPNILNCTFVGNKIVRAPIGYAHGGAICTSGASNVTVTKCTFENNIGEGADTYGGAIYCGGGNCTIIECSFEDNSAISGGAIYVTAAIVSISSSSIRNNKAGYGGGIANTRHVTIEKCYITGNTANDGGGIHNDSSGRSDIINSIICDNTASGFGGGFYGWVANSAINSCTFSNNTSGSGGAIAIYGQLWVEPGNLSVINCILWNNSPDEIYALFYREDDYSITYSNVQDGYEGEGNINMDPLFYDFNDYHLRVQSPSIDSGTSEGAPDDDIEDTKRPDGAGFDMGADEYKYDGACPTDLDNDSDVDGSDLATFAGEETGITLEDFAANFGEAECS